MTALTTTIDNRYGGYTFSVMSETTGIQGTPVYDPAGRTIAYWVWSITIRDIIQNDTEGASQDVDDAIVELTKPAQALYYVDAGMKNLRINVSGQKDVVWGPKPQMISVKPKGDGNAVEITWNVQVALPEFGVTVPGGKPMMFNYSLSTSISRAGISRRTYTASLQIPLTRTSPNSRALTDNADRFLEEINPPLIPGFRRGDRQRSLDEAKTKLTYTLVDEELPSTNVPPPGCVDATAEHSIETDSFAMLTWTGSITANYELVKGLTREVAVSYFTELAADRLKTAQKNAQALAVIPTRLSIREANLYGVPSIHFALNYKYTTTIKNLLESHGLFRPVPGSDWQKWATSLQNTAWAPRGLAGLKFDNSHDAIVDLGSPKEQLPLPARTRIGTGQFGINLTNLFEKPSADKSWVMYENSIQITHLDEVSVLKKLPATALKIAGASVLALTGPINGYITPYVGPAAEVVVQKRAEPTYVAILTGKALRAGYPVPTPLLTQVGGVAATPANLEGFGFASKVAGNWSGVPLVGAHWRLRYVLAGRPGPTQIPQSSVLSEGRDREVDKTITTAGDY